VQPDYEVEQDPKLVYEGHDPQLEKAVALALEQLAKNPPPTPKRPEYPNYQRTAKPTGSGTVGGGGR
jgi:tricorn protease